MANYSGDQYSDEHNTLPRKNVEWLEAIVKWTRYDYVAMYDYPTTNNSDTVMEVFKGDTVQISRRYRREDWCLCRIGHVLGWVFLQDVRFIVQGASAPRPKQRKPRTQPMPVPQPVEEHITPLDQIKQDVCEVETQPYMRVEVSEPEPLPFEAVEEPTIANEKKPLIERLIKFFRK